MYNIEYLTERDMKYFEKKEALGEAIIIRIEPEMLLSLDLDALFRDREKDQTLSAKELEDKASVGDELSQSYLSEYERILRTYFCGFWIGESDNPDYPYSVIYITENNEMYWSYAYSIPPSSIEEQLAIVDQYGEDYRFSVGRIEFNKPLREMSMYSGTTLTSDKLVIRMVSDDIARIKDINLSSERNFTRLK